LSAVQNNQRLKQLLLNNMASPFHTCINNYDVASGGDAENVTVAAPVSNSHQVIIDLSQDDSDNDAMSMEVVEIFDSPVLAERRVQQLDVNRFAQLFNNEERNHPPLSITHNATTTTSATTSAAYVAHQPLAQSTTTAAQSNWESNERPGGVPVGRRNRQNHNPRDRANQNGSASTSFKVPMSNSQSVRLENTNGHNNSTYHRRRHHHQQQESIPTHHGSHQRITRVLTDNSSTNQSAARTITVQSPRVTFSPELFHLPSTGIQNQQRNHRNRGSNRRRAYAGAAVAHGANQAMQQHRLFSVVHHLAQEQLLRRHDGLNNNYPHHNNNLGGRLLNLDNLSYEDMLSIFGNGNENCGAAVTDISLLPVIPVTKDDVISSESDVDGTCSQDHADLNSNKYCCSVCLENYRIGEQKKILPCFHNFHENCIDQWLIQNGSCPICKHRISGLS
jgi:Ring finger domain